MNVVGYMLLTVARVLGMLINLYTFIVAIAVLITWVRPDPYNPIVRFLHMATEPAFRMARRFIPNSIRYRTHIDFAPIMVFVLLIVIETFFLGLLRDLAYSFLGGQ